MNCLQGLHGHSIHTLDLCYCYAILTDEKLIQIANQCPNLRVGIFFSCFGLSDQSIVHISSICLYLRVLNLGGCKGITNVSLAAIGEHLLYLETLCIAGCPQVNDVGIQFLLPASRVIFQIDAKHNPVHITNNDTNAMLIIYIN